MQIQVDVTVSGTIFSGDGLHYAHSTLPEDLAASNFIDHEVQGTSAVFTVIRQVSTCVNPTSFGTWAHQDVKIVALSLFTSDRDIS